MRRVWSKVFLNHCYTNVTVVHRCRSHLKRQISVWPTGTVATAENGEMLVSEIQYFYISIFYVVYIYFIYIYIYSSNGARKLENDIVMENKHFFILPPRIYLYGSTVECKQLHYISYISSYDKRKKERERVRKWEGERGK